jgi:HKD family nuclease
LVTREFILQGITARTHGEAIRELFDVADVQRAIISVAFLTESGVDQIAPKIAQHAATTTVFAGIRNDITSFQGMKRLFEAGVALHAVDTGTRHLLFHPKLYYVRSKKLARLSIGSANLTLGGLNNNIEAGIVLDFDPDDKNDASFLTDLEKQFDGLAPAHPDNIYLVEKPKRLDELLAAGLLVDEDAAPPPRVTTSSNTGAVDPTPRMKLSVTPLRKVPKKASAPQAVPVPLVSGAPAPATPAQTSAAGPAPAAPGFELMWMSKDLTERDLTIPTGSNTNPTGSINLDKGMMAPSVDHRHYFRSNVFAALTWTPRSSTVDETNAIFELVLKGVYQGAYDLKIRHTTSTTSASYLQNNAMTRLSWGDMAPLIKQPSLVGRSMSLYRDKANPTLFMIEID